MNRPALILVSFLVWGTFSGATCVPRPPVGPLPPQAFQASPTLDDLIYVLNANTARVSQLQTEDARVSTTGLPTALRADITLERPRKFRLRARAFGPEIDLGSNDQFIWFWANRDPENAVYFADHRGLTGEGGSAGPLPVEPEWLVQSFGLVELSPQDIHQGPYPRGSDQVEVHTQLRRPAGDLVRSIVVDLRYAWILEQRVSDSAGRPLAVLRASNHSFYKEVGVSLPHRIEIELPPVGASFQVDVSHYLINQITEDPASIWTMPAFDGRRQINLADLSQPVAPLAGRGYDTANRAAFRPEYRGLRQSR